MVNSIAGELLEVNKLARKLVEGYTLRAWEVGIIVCHRLLVCARGRQNKIVALVNAIEIRDTKELKPLVVGVLNDCIMYFLYDVRGTRRSRNVNTTFRNATTL